LAEPQAGSAVPSTSGKTLLALADYLSRTYGPQALRNVLSRLPPRSQRDLSGILMPTLWYPTAALVEAIEAAQAVYGPDHFYEQFGQAAARYSIHAFYRFILRFKTPHWMLERAASIWQQFHTHGKWSIQMGERDFQAQLQGFAAPGTYCRVLCGWITGAGQLTGAPEVQVTHPRCRAAGAAECHFQGCW
jgi:hypothetical protein